ncbi:MAG: hypothetical protein AAGA56_11520, partial [Myxococcota bacterium]
VAINSDGTQPFSWVLASFTEGGAALNCVQEVASDSCTVTRCTDPNPGAPVPLRFGAGTITVEGDLRTAVVAYDGSRYVEPQASDFLYTAGAMVAFSASGSDRIDPFEGSVVAPARIQLTAPSLSPPFVIDRTADLDLTWTGGGGGVLNVGVSGRASPEAAESVSVDCEFDPTSGAATVPAVALAELPETSSGEFFAAVRETKQIEVGDASVLLAVQEEVKADGPRGTASLSVANAVVIQ